MVATANKDEGLKCLHIAKQALEAGDVAKAERFGEKAMKLYPHDEVRKFMVQLRHRSDSGQRGGGGGSSSGAGGGGGAAAGRRSQPSGMGPSPGLRQRQQQAAKQEDHSEDHKATPEQRTLVASILRTKCYYEVLGVEKGAGDDDIKRAYRKLALKLHPDKNRARGADEAFKLVSKAFSCLSDPDKRRSYDTYGAEEPPGLGPRGGGGGGFGGRGGGMYGDVDPEEIFNMFFGGNPFMNPRARVFRTNFGPRQYDARRPQQQQNQQPPSPLLQLMQFAPLLLLLLFSYLSRPSTPVFSLSQSRDYPHAFATATYSVPYYVRDAQEFHRTHPPGSRERVRLEHQVEGEYRESLQLQCRNERLVQQRYAYYGYKQKAADMELRHCAELVERFGSKQGAGRTAGVVH